MSPIIFLIIYPSFLQRGDLEKGFAERWVSLS